MNQRYSYGSVPLADPNEIPLNQSTRLEAEDWLLPQSQSQSQSRNLPPPFDCRFFHMRIMMFSVRYL